MNHALKKEYVCQKRKKRTCNRLNPMGLWRWASTATPCWLGSGVFLERKLFENSRQTTPFPTHSCEYTPMQPWHACMHALRAGFLKWQILFTNHCALCSRHWQWDIWNRLYTCCLLDALVGLHFVPETILALLLCQTCWNFGAKRCRHVDGAINGFVLSVVMSELTQLSAAGEKKGGFLFAYLYTITFTRTLCIGCKNNQ